jgi:hypothetical protein
MTLAQVVYRISTDSDFAARMQKDPESALKESSFNLSKEEHAFLSNGLRRGLHDDGSRVAMQELSQLYVGWR